MTASTQDMSVLLGDTKLSVQGTRLSVGDPAPEVTLADGWITSAQMLASTARQDPPDQRDPVHPDAHLRHAGAAHERGSRSVGRRRGDHHHQRRPAAGAGRLVRCCRCGSRPDALRSPGHGLW
ncbi:MAG: hypothetical protein R2856_00130 [Caldilineaceae bacterium]